MNEARLNKVLRQMAERNIPQMAVCDPVAIFYLTGKWIHPGERMLALYLRQDGGHKLFLNKLFHVPEELGVEKVWFDDTDDSVGIMAGHIDKKAVMGIDKNWPSHFLLRLMNEKGDSAFVNGSVIVDRIRACKDERERDFMREASRLNDLAMDRLIKLVPGEHTEKKLAKLLSGIYEEVGADGLSFDPIIAYGANAADPHHSPGDFGLKAGDCVILDIGCQKNSYCSDMTRTVFYKQDRKSVV